VYTTFCLYLCLFYICWISYKHVKIYWHEMPTKKNINLENIRRNLVWTPSCRGQNKTIMSTRLSRLNTVYCACSSNILTQYQFAFQVFRLILNVILHMEYGAVRVKWHHFGIQHLLIYLKTSPALVWSTVIDKIYLLLIFNQDIPWQNNSVYMKFWDTQTLWPLL